MRTRIFISTICLIAVTGSSFAQNISDAIRYSYLTYNSSARNAGLNNSIGALGTDFGAISQNPGGLGWYRSSEFNFSLATTGYNTNAALFGTNNTSTESSVRRFGLPGMGLVLNTEPVGSKWKHVNFAIGYNQVASFRQEYGYKGISKGSIMDYFVEQAQGKTADQLDDFSTALAYNAYGIYDPDTKNNNDKEWTSDFAGVGKIPLVSKSQDVVNRGYMSEILMALGANYDDKFAVGASLGIPVLRYETQKYYQENTSGPDTIPYFHSLSWTENVEAKGAGVNLKLGASFRPIQAVRLGVAIHTPTALAISESYNNSLVYDFTTPDGSSYNEKQRSPDGAYDYSMFTPWRFIGDAGIIVGKHGFLSAEVEYVDYPNASFKFNNTADDPDAKEYERTLNKEITQNLKSGVNYKLGAEVVLGDFRIRGGYGIYATPYANDSNTNSSYSFGLGARLEKFYFDLGYVHTQQSQTYKPYVVNNVETQALVNTESNADRIILTIGFRF